MVSCALDASVNNDGRQSMILNNMFSQSARELFNGSKGQLSKPEMTSSLRDLIKTPR